MSRNKHYFDESPAFSYGLAWTTTIDDDDDNDDGGDDGHDDDDGDDEERTCSKLPLSALDRSPLKAEASTSSSVPLMTWNLREGQQPQQRVCVC